MNFNNEKEYKEFLKNLKFCSEGSTAVVLRDLYSKKAYKIYKPEYTDYLMDLDLQKIINLKNDTYIFPTDAIYFDDQILGVVYPFVKGKLMFFKNPLSVNLKQFEKSAEKARIDAIKLSNQGIETYDVQLNTMLSNNKIKVIDTEEYKLSNKSESKIEEKNLFYLNKAIKDFIVFDNCLEFEKDDEETIYTYKFLMSVINNNKNLKELYRDKNANVTTFLKELRNNLSEYMGKEMEYLPDYEEIEEIKENKMF